jgi:hypothetical protein
MSRGAAFREVHRPQIQGGASLDFKNALIVIVLILIILYLVGVNVNVG